MQVYHEIKKTARILIKNPLRSLLSTLGILFGAAAVVTMLSIGEGAKQETLEQIEQLGVNSIIIRQTTLTDEQRVQNFEKNSRDLSLEDALSLQKNIPFHFRISPLKSLTPFMGGPLSLLSPEILAITRSYSEMRELQLMEGRFICDIDLKKKKLVCVLGYAIAKGLGASGHIGQSLRLDSNDYEIVGVLQSTHWKKSKNQLITGRNIDQAIFIPLGSENGLKHSPQYSIDSLSEITLQIHNVKQMQATIQLVKQVLRKLHGGIENYQILIPQELLQQAFRTQQTFNWVLGSLATISLIVGGIGIMNVMLASIAERTREIGIRRAVGATKKHILSQFLLETILLTTLGGILGVILGIASAFLVSQTAGWKTIVAPWSILLSLFMTVVVGLFSGIYPAYRASNMDPIQALRSE